ncbi:MAG: outer membrane beta-barrel protein [Acidobacteriota bacterium]
MTQTMKKLVPFLSVIVLMCSAAVALAQGTTSDDYPKVEVFAGYSALGEANSGRITFGPTASTDSNYATPTGFQTSVIGNFSKHFGIKGDFSAHFGNDSGRRPFTACTPTCTTATQDFQFKTRVYNFLAGPEFKARNSTRFTPFAYALAGVAHTSATFTTSGPTLNLLLKKSDNSLAMALGGGLDIRAGKRVSLRGTMDYNPVFIRDSGSDRRDLVRFSLGFLFR